MVVNQLILDTSAYSVFKRGHTQAISAIQTATKILMPVTVLGELFAGFVVGIQTERNRAELDAFLQNGRVQIVPVKTATAERYASIYKYLRQQGKPIPTNDLWIAASTMEHSATLLTADSHFSYLPQILVQIIA